MTSKELREKRAPLAVEIRRLADKANSDDSWTAEDEERWQKVNKEYNELTALIEKAERAEAVEAEQRELANDIGAGREDLRGDRPEDSRVEPTDEDRALAFQAWALVQSRRDITDRHREAAERCGVSLTAPDYEIRLPRNYAEVRAAMTTSSGVGGETIPAGFVRNFERALLQFGGVRKVATVIRTDSGNQLTWPTTDDTSNKGALISENTADTEQGVATSSITLNAYKYTSKLIKVSAELLQDSAFDLASVVASMAGERIGRILNDHFTTGTGTGQPNGIVTAATLGVTAASATAITANELLELVHSVDPAYRDGATWMMHDNIVLEVRKLQNATSGDYIWQSSWEANVPDRLLGYPIVVNQSMASSLAASNKVILFGQLSKYIIRDVASMRIRRLVERYAENDVEAFVALSRHDGELLDAGTNPVKYLQMAAS